MNNKKYWRKQATESIKSLISFAKTDYETSGSKWIVMFDKDRWMVTVLYDESMTQNQIDIIECKVNGYLAKQENEYYLKVAYGVLKKIVIIPQGQ